MDRITFNKAWAIQSAILLGHAVASAVSYSTWKSILWAIIHGVLGWIYVIYYAIKY